MEGNHPNQINEQTVPMTKLDLTGNLRDSIPSNRDRKFSVNTLQDESNLDSAPNQLEST